MDKVLALLAQLENAQLVGNGAGNELVYRFKHALTQEAAYQSLLVKKRREIHLHVAQAYEQQYVGNLDEYAGLLVEHYAMAQDDDRLASYALKAGHAAMRVNAYAEARSYYTRALEALSRLPETDDNRRLYVDALTKLVSASFASDSPERNFQRMSQAESLALQLTAAPDPPRADRLRLVRIHFWMGDARYFRNRLPEALGYYRQTIKEARLLADTSREVIASSAMARVLTVQGHFDQGGEMSASVAEPFERVANWPEWVWAVAFRGQALAQMGEYVEGTATVQRALARALATHNLLGVAAYYLSLVIIYMLGRDLAHARGVNQAAQAAVASGDLVMAYSTNGFQSWIESRLGLHEAAAESMRQALTIQDKLGGQLLFEDWFAAIRGELALNAGRVDEAVELSKQAASLAQLAGGIFAEGMARQVWGRAAHAVRSVLLGTGRRTVGREHAPV
ncbi:MAG: hypothetical protein WCF84_06740 [Anaerolineae bacterium]